MILHLCYYEHYCLECDKTRPFVDGFCFFCGSTSPVGDPNDETIDEAQWELENGPRYWMEVEL